MKSLFITTDTSNRQNITVLLTQLKDLSPIHAGSDLWHSSEPILEPPKLLTDPQGIDSEAHSSTSLSQNVHHFWLMEVWQLCCNMIRRGKKKTQTHFNAFLLKHAGVILSPLRNNIKASFKLLWLEQSFINTELSSMILTYLTFLWNKYQSLYFTSCYIRFSHYW